MPESAQCVMSMNPSPWIISCLRRLSQNFFSRTSYRLLVIQPPWRYIRKTQPNFSPSLDMRVNVSIVIPVLNEEARIATAIERAWAAGGSQVIVVDGGSKDETAEIARDARCQFLASPPGRAQQQNFGAAEATGEVLLFLHADTWLAKGAAAQIPPALRDPRVVCGAFLQAIDAEGRAYRLLERGNALRARVLGLAYGDQGIFVLRKTFQAIGGFPKVRLMEDLLLMRTLRTLHPPRLLPGPLHVSPRRWQQEGVVGRTLRNWSLLAAESLGVPPDRLAQFYAAIR